MICGSTGSKSRLLKRRVRSHLARWEMKNCTPLWARTTVGSWDVQNNMNAVVVRSALRSQNAQNTSASEHFWKLRCWKGARRCGAKHISKSKCTNHNKCVCATFGRWSVVLCGRRKGFCTLPKVSKTWRFCSISKSDGRRGTFEEDLQRWISRGNRSTRDIFIRDVRRSGRWFPEWGCILEHQIFRVAKRILRDRCSTLYDLASLFRSRRNTLDTWTGNNRKAHWHEDVRSALNFPLLKEVSQNCFVFDVANFNTRGSLAELFRCWRCQVQKLRKTRRSAAFLMLPAWKIEEARQNSLVFKLADRQIDR